jgi:transcriptional regulator with XRE-family HTH domain
LAEQRTKAGLSREELARRIGISYSAVAKYETGERIPPPDVLAKLAETLRISVDYLLGRTGTPHPPAAAPTEEEEEPWPEGVQVLRRASSKLTPEKKRLLIRLIEATLAEEEEEEKQRERETGGQANHSKGQPGPKGRLGGPAGKQHRLPARGRPGARAGEGTDHPV